LILTITTLTFSRALAFSIVDIKSVEVRINDENWIQCTRIKGPLYVVEWNPSIYKTGIHHIQVVEKKVYYYEINTIC
jgi:hypothetical protein